MNRSKARRDSAASTQAQTVCKSVGTSSSGKNLSLIKEARVLPNGASWPLEFMQPLLIPEPRNSTTLPSAIFLRRSASSGLGLLDLERPDDLSDIGVPSVSLEGSLLLTKL